MHIWTLSKYWDTDCSRLDQKLKWAHAYGHIRKSNVLVPEYVTKQYAFIFIIIFFKQPKLHLKIYVFLGVFFYYTSSPPFTSTTLWNPLLETTTRTKSVHVRKQPPCRALITDVKWIANEPTVTGRFWNRCFSCFYHEYMVYVGVVRFIGYTRVRGQSRRVIYPERILHTIWDEPTQEENYS